MVEPSESAAGAHRLRRYAMVGTLGVVAGILVTVLWGGHDDGALGKALVGTWNAVDPSDAVLHRREVPVTGEWIVFRPGPDGTLTHSVELESKPGAPEEDLWGWKIHKGRLYVRFLGEEGTKQWLPGFPFSVSEKNLTILVDDNPPKTFTRS